MDERKGTGKVMKEAVEASQLPARPEQQELLLGDGGPLLVDENDEVVVADGRRAGRPAGAANRATKEFRDFILSQHRSPLLTLARLQSQDPLTLARQLGCKPTEALDRIIRAAECLAPYMHQKQAIAVDVSNTKTVTLTILDGVAGGPDHQGDNDIIDLLPITVDENGGGT